MDRARGLIRIHETGRWAHINVKLLHFVNHLTPQEIFIDYPIPDMSTLSQCSEGHLRAVASGNTEWIPTPNCISGRETPHSNFKMESPSSTGVPVLRVYCIFVICLQFRNFKESELVCQIHANQGSWQCKSDNPTKEESLAYSFQVLQARQDPANTVLTVQGNLLEIPRKYLGFLLMTHSVTASREGIPVLGDTFIPDSDSLGLLAWDWVKIEATTIHLIFFIAGVVYTQVMYHWTLKLLIFPCN